MISYIKGKVRHLEEDALVVENNDIGYLVFVPARVLEGMSVGVVVEIYTYQHVREDSLDLFGFLDRNDLGLFTKLILVSGVGPRLALSVLSALAADNVKRAIIHGDISTLTSIPGVGKKTAERIVLDLKESVDIIPGDSDGSVSSSQELSTVDVLLSLGYSRSEALDVMGNVNPDDPIEEQVRQALKQLASS